MDVQKPKIYIVLYSLYHHIYKLATCMAEGAEANGCEVKIFQVQETLSDNILEKMKAPPKPDLPIITASELAAADGILFGVPTRFGTFPAQVKTLLDATGSLWAKGGLAQKFAGFFVSCASQHGGFETTPLTAVTYLVHHGINFVPFGYTNPALFDNSKVICGSAYGAGTSTNGDGSRQPIAEELEISKHQGAQFAKFLVTYYRGVKKLSTAGGIKDTQATTGQTQSPPPSSQGKGAVVATAAGAGAGAVGVGAAAASAAQKNSNTGDVSTGAPGTNQPSTAVGSQGKSADPISAGQQQPLETTTQAPKETNQTTGTNTGLSSQAAGAINGEKPQELKKKKKGLWFCCGNKDDLD